MRLKSGESGRYQRAAGHTVAWVALSKGGLTLPERIDAGELVIFGSGDVAIEFRADGDSDLILGSVAEHRHDLVLGYYSVRASPASPTAGERRIEEIRLRLQKEGRT